MTERDDEVSRRGRVEVFVRLGHFLLPDHSLLTLNASQQLQFIMASQVPIPEPIPQPAHEMGESGTDKMRRKFRENPIVPIGESFPSRLHAFLARSTAQHSSNKADATLIHVRTGSLLTVGALTTASIYLRRGNRDMFQKMLRWRVGLQGITVVGMVAGSLYFGSGEASTSTDPRVANSSTRPPTVSQVERAEQKREADRVELHERIREAEANELAKDAREKEAVENLLRTGGGASRPRPVIGQDKRTF